MGTGTTARRALALATTLLALTTGSAIAAFPYAPQGAPDDYSSYFLPPSAPVPGDLGGKLDWMYASTPPPAGGDAVKADRRELGGVRGGWVVDKDRAAPQAWHTTTGRPDVAIAVLDSGIKWDSGDMRDIRLKTRISKGEAKRPQPTATATSTEPGQDCSRHEAAWDANGDGVFNVADYACDPRVSADPPNGVGLKLSGVPVLDPQDVLIAFTDGTDDDANGYADDMIGWDFLDDDNDPYDDVQYGHGTGEAKDSAGEADNGGDLGSCPNCMEIHLRVGTSFIADVNRFALATIYATDNGIDVVQEALGTLNKSKIGADAVKYAYDHGVTVIASAADEAAQHHNWPSSYPYSIVVNSVTHADEADGAARTSYLAFNGCTNFSSRITLAIPSVSCSSDATGRGAGMAGLVYAAARNAAEAGTLEAHPTCRRTDGSPCPVTANEVRQIMASGTFGDTPAADDVNFAVDPVTGADTDRRTCGATPTPGCTDPFAAITGTALPRVAAPLSYPAREGHDQFYGYGRVNMDRAVDATAAGTIPPEVEVVSPEWYEMVDPGQETLSVRGEVWARGAEYACRVYVAPGSYPKDVPVAEGGDFVEVSRGACDGSARTTRVDGEIASLDVDDVAALFPATAGDFRGPEGGATGQKPNPTGNVGRPNDEPYGFTVKVVATTTGPSPVTGADRRQAYLHRDQDMLPGFPKQLPGDGEASPVLADLDGDNRTELVLANSDGLVHAFRPDGSQLPGYPVRTDLLPLHPQGRAFATGAVAPAHGAVLGTPAVGDLDADGALELVVADLEGKVYAFDAASGERRWTYETNRAYAGIPQAPFVNIRRGKMHRVQSGFIASPVLADLDGEPGHEVVAASMDRHVYALDADGEDVRGWPVLVGDRAKMAAIDQQTHAITFKQPDFMQGAIISTPAVGDLDGDRRPEIVVGTNEEYEAAKDGGLNAGGPLDPAFRALGQALTQANGRLYAIPATGEPAGPAVDRAPWLPGWPFKVGILQAEILPLVGEGITGAPIIGRVPCGRDVTRAPRVGVIPAAGLPYLIGADGRSCTGRTQDRDDPLPVTGGKAADPVFLAAFGHPAFAELSTGTAFLAPVAGLTRALDVVLPEYQGGQDYLAAWSTGGSLLPGWPAEVNDLQFLTGPTVGDLVPAKPGDEILAGTAHHDLQGFDAAGADADPSWPKLTGDWTVANPALGAFGVRESQPDARKSVIHATRNGRLLAYGTEVAACAHASWPQFHHDANNSGDLDRDAIAPGTPEQATVTAGALRFLSPGDDRLCGTPDRIEVVTDDAPITPATFGAARALEVIVAPAEAGTQITALLGRTDRYVAVRAIDEQGNVGRPAVVDTTP